MMEDGLIARGSSYLILFALYIFMARESRGGGILLASPQPAGLNFGGMFGGRYYTYSVVVFFLGLAFFPSGLPPGTGTRDSRPRDSRLAGGNPKSP